jgi:hypothetical protein
MQAAPEKGTLRHRTGCGWNSTSVCGDQVGCLPKGNPGRKRPSRHTVTPMDGDTPFATYRPTEWTPREIPVTCRRCGTTLAVLAEDEVEDHVYGAVPVGGLFPVAGQAIPSHAGKATGLRCPQDGHRAVVKASTLWRRVGDDLKVTSLPV